MNYFYSVYDYFFGAPKPETKNKADKDGLPNGLWENYYFNERIQSRGFYNHGVRVGEWTFWDERGNPKKINF